MIMPAFGEHPTHSATQASRKAAAGAGDASGGFKPADREASTVRRREESQQQACPRGEDARLAQPAARSWMAVAYPACQRLIQRKFLEAGTDHRSTIEWEEAENDIDDHGSRIERL